MRMKHMVLWLLLPSLAWAQSPQGAKAKRALEKFNKGRVAFEKAARTGRTSDFQKAERFFQEALRLVPKDHNRLQYEDQGEVSQEEGRWRDNKPVILTKHAAYLPNQYLGKIRTHLPPKPLVIASLRRQANGYGLSLRLRNEGLSPLTDFHVKVTGASTPAPAQNQRLIRPGEEKRFYWKLAPIPRRGTLRISFSERFGMVPPPLTLNTAP